jgi:hypothetical protein
MSKNQNTWSHRTNIIFREIKMIFHPLGSLVVFPARVIVLWQKNVRGTRNASLVVDVVFKCLRQCSKYAFQQYFTCMCFLGVYSYFSEYYTFIACWWGKYENLFTQEYHIPWGQRPRGLWYSWVNTFSYFLNPHAINVLLYRTIKCVNFICNNWIPINR